MEVLKQWKKDYFRSKFIVLAIDPGNIWRHAYYAHVPGSPR